MADKQYKSSYTGTQIDLGIEKALSITANPTLVGDENDLTGLQVGSTKYKIPSGGTEVIANPTLAGTEAALTGLQVGDTKYSVGNHLYLHHISINQYQANMYNVQMNVNIINDSPEPFTKIALSNYLYKDQGNRYVNGSQSGTYCHTFPSVKYSQIINQDYAISNEYAPRIFAPSNGNLAWGLNLTHNEILFSNFSDMDIVQII